MRSRERMRKSDRHKPVAFSTEQIFKNIFQLTGKSPTLKKYHIKKYITREIFKNINVYVIKNLKNM